MDVAHSPGYRKKIMDGPDTGARDDGQDAWSGLLAGLGVALPLGVIGVLIVRRVVSVAFRSADSGTSAVALVDTTYCAFVVLQHCAFVVLCSFFVGRRRRRSPA